MKKTALKIDIILFPEMDHHDAYIHLILGPMFAEKSTNLLRQFRRFKISKKFCLLVKYQGDNRYTDKNYIATHDKVMSSEQAYPCHHLADLEHQVNLQNYDVICIDEIQFYPDSVLYCQKWRSEGKIIIASGLYANFKREPFHNLPQLLALADKIEFLTSICHDCHRDQGSTSYRMSEETAEVVIGGHDSYVALCQGCYEKRCYLKKRQKEHKSSTN